jgi:hypothetical protein
MGMDWVYLAPTPIEEDCAQLGQDNYRNQAMKEMTVFCNQLYRDFPEAENKGVYFRIKWQSHDFGTYGEVVAAYDDNDLEAMDYAIHVENNIPEHWDEESIKELEGE